jgi:hypothetical protein
MRSGRRDNEHVRAWRDRSAIPFLVMGAALGLLLLLALLQYQWIGQLGEAERERLRIHLRAALSRLAQEFNGELARALAMLSPARALPPERELEELAERWQAWKESAPHPELVRAYYITEGGEEGLDQVLVFKEDQGGFQPSAWPERLLPLRARLALRAGERGALCWMKNTASWPRPAGAGPGGHGPASPVGGRGSNGPLCRQAGRSWSWITTFWSRSSCPNSWTGTSGAPRASISCCRW